MDGRRQRLDVEHVDRGACDLFIPQCADQGLLIHDRPREVLIKRAVDFISASSAAPPDCVCGRSTPDDRQNVCLLEELILGDEDCTAAWAASGSCFDSRRSIHAKSAADSGHF